MITKNDWDAALDSWVIAERERLGGPPTPEEVVAYTRGELAPPDAARVRALLVYYPELTSLLTPMDEAPVQIAQRRRSWTRFMPLAAGLIIALLTMLLVQSRWQLAQRARESRQPYIHETRHVLQELRARGAPMDVHVYELPAGEQRYLLALSVFDEQQSYSDYRVEIVDATSTARNVVWSESARQPVNGAIELTVPRQLIERGTYRIDVFGVEPDRADLLASFHVRVQDGG
jgi:hypothetical protein